MADKPSARIIDFVDALPLRDGQRVLEIGCGPGAAAREVCRRIGDGYVLGVDRSPKAIASARRASALQLEAGCLEFRVSAAETFALLPGERPFDLAFAMRVGAFDGRHPESGVAALRCIKAALNPGARFFVDTGNPAEEIPL